MQTYLLVVLASPAAGLNENEALSTFDILVAERAPLAMLDRKVVCSPINELEGREDLRQLSLDGAVQRLHIVKVWQREDDVVRGLRRGRRQNRDSGNDAERALSADEQLLEVVACRRDGVRKKLNNS